jgi:hypothetical protein
MGQNNQGGGGNGGGYRTELDRVNDQYDQHMNGANMLIGLGLGAVVAVFNPLAGAAVALSFTPGPQDHHQAPRRQ